MAVTLSLFAGAGAQFFDNNGVILTGGKIYTYAAGTTTPAPTYTTVNGNVFHTNPIILDSAGRLPAGGELWLPIGIGYKFVIKTSAEVLISTYDNIPSAAQPPAANDADSIMYEQGYIVTAGSFVAGKMYRIVSIGSTDFTLIGANANTVGLHFIATGAGTGDGTAELSQTVETKLRQTISIKDFGANPSASASVNTTAIADALTYAGTKKCAVYIPGEATAYQVDDEFTVPDGVTVYGDGWGSFIQQTTLNKDVFIAGDCNTFHNLRLKIADGNNADFVNCIYATNVNNLTVENCFLEPGDLGGCGIHIRGVQNSQIRGNRIYGGKWTGSVAGAAASAADILLYSFGTSERHIIDGNHCLSNNSQGMFISALGYDGDIIISNNICVTLDPATCTEAGTWSLIANGGVRRHGIVASYSNAQPGRPRTVIDSNICRNTLWTGIYKQGLSDGETIISNNLCDLNGYVVTSLAGGVYVESPGTVSVVGNTISNFQSASATSGGITINQATPENIPSLISNNKIIGSNGSGISLGTFSRLVTIANNVITGSAFADIYISNSSGDANTGGNTIVENSIYRTSGDNVTGVFVDQGGSTRSFIVKNNYIQGFDNTNNSQNNVAIVVRDTTSRAQIENNTMQNFYFAFRCTAGYNSGRMNDRVIQNNVIRDCAVGFLVFSTVNNDHTLPLVGNVFINTPVQVTGDGNPEVGRIVTRQGNNFVWQTTASPSVGSWDVGDRSVNSTPAIGQPKAWTCTVAGAPGTWVSEGNL